MTDLEKMREWLKTFPGGIPDNFQVDFTNEIPQTAGLFPTGTVEIRRARDILGNVTVTNQYNFGLYTVFAKPTDADEVAARSAEWVMSLQRWVQEQSAQGLSPTFGNIDTWAETLKAQNGMFYGDNAAGTGMYMVTITAQYQTEYEAPEEF
jgi:hypothetical protein